MVHKIAPQVCSLTGQTLTRGESLACETTRYGIFSQFPSFPPTMYQAPGTYHWYVRYKAPVKEGLTTYAASVGVGEDE